MGDQRSARELETRAAPTRGGCARRVCPATIINRAIGNRLWYRIQSDTGVIIETLLQNIVPVLGNSGHNRMKAVSARQDQNTNGR